MDREIWTLIVSRTRRLARRLFKHGRRPRYPDVLIVLMLHWAAWHDRPMCWACRRSSYTTLFRPRRLPSASQFSRRLRTESVLDLLQALHNELAQIHRSSPVSYFDGKPLPVGESSKDKDARTGRGAGKFSRGYKLHAYVTEDARIPVWHVTPLNTGEPVVAAMLCAHIPRPELALADANYDSVRVYQEVGRRGGALLTPLRNKAKKPQDLSRMAPERAAAVRLWNQAPGLCGYVYQLRATTVERVFGNATSFGGGLGPLPAWVRTLPRVRRWVGAKLNIYHARLLARHARVA
jgi:hypothetical protein